MNDFAEIELLKLNEAEHKLKLKKAAFLFEAKSTKF